MFDVMFPTIQAKFDLNYKCYVAMAVWLIPYDRVRFRYAHYVNLRWIQALFKLEVLVMSIRLSGHIPWCFYDTSNQHHEGA